MTTRRPVESFSFPVEKIKEGYYTDAYFMRSEEILNGDNYHPRVLMQVFARDHVVVCGTDEVIALIRQCAFHPETIEIHSLRDGEEVDEWETVMTIEGDYADFAHLETIYLGILARQSRIATNVSPRVKVPTASRCFSSLHVMIFTRLRNPTAMQLWLAASTASLPMPMLWQQAARVWVLSPMH